MIVGMDFGTTNSGMSVYDGENLHLIPLDRSNRNPHVARSALYITNDRRVYIGRSAVEQYYQENLNRPSKIERIHVGEIEMTFSELPTFVRDVYIEKDTLSPGRLFLSFKMGLSSPNYLGTIVGNQYFFLEDIIATYLYITRKRAEAHLNTTLDTIVLGRPVRFSDEADANAFARERLVQAAFLAGYKTVYLQYEPIAAAHYYETTIGDEQKALIFDFGGGTLDMSVVQLGNPKTRRVIANGGIPIAGDIFDQRIVRTKLPQHFGEGTTYRSGNHELPVPPALYDAFTDWQTLLTMQLPKDMENLRRIAHNAQQPRKIEALMSLITGQYGLKMFDVAEQAKRQLSDRETARLDMAGADFKVFETIRRTEFERMIRTEVRAIAERLDHLLEDAKLKPADIDAVIRTGGSSQIPVFVEMLETRFGAEKVRNIDAFASVTSGLGVIAHQIECGESSLQAYHRDSTAGERSLHADVKTRVPAIEMRVLKQLIDSQERRASNDDPRPIFLTRAADQSLYAQRVADQTELTALDRAIDDPNFAQFLSPDERLLLLTTEYTCYVKTAAELADLSENSLALADLEGFRADAFGREYVYSLARWQGLQAAEQIIVMSSLGYVHSYSGQAFLERISQPIAYKVARSRGYPATLVAAQSDHDYVAVTHAGRAARIPISKLTLREQRLLSVPLKGNIVGAIAGDNEMEFIVATASGYAGRWTIGTIPPVADMNTTGHKLTNRSNPIIAMPYYADAQLFALTNQRITPIKQGITPFDLSDYRLLKLKNGERLLTLFYTEV